MEKSSKIDIKNDKKPRADEKASNTYQISCYECNTPGVLRRDCINCNKTVKEKKDFSMITMETDATARPILHIEILGHVSRGITDTGAKNSIASESLYHMYYEKKRS